MLAYDIFAKVLFYIECSKYILFIFRSVLFQVTPVTCLVSLKYPKQSARLMGREINV